MNAATASPALEVGGISIARLHGEACIRCGAVYSDLVPAGTVTVGDRTWNVVSCRAHAGESS